MIAAMPKPAATRDQARPEPIPPRHIVGNAEVRRICGGVTRHTLITWRKSHGFPAPVRKLESGEIWDARAVREWWRSWQDR
jgi:hypothetical protein